MSWCAALCLFSIFPNSSAAEDLGEEITAVDLWGVLLLWFALICLLLCWGEVRVLLPFWAPGELLMLVSLCEETLSSVCLVRETWSAHLCDTSSCCCSFCIFSCMLLNSAVVKNGIINATHVWHNTIKTYRETFVSDFPLLQKKKNTLISHFVGYCSTAS